MGIVKPTGGYAEQMLEPGAWPEVDEDSLYDRAQQYTEVLRRVTEVLEATRHQQSEIFDGGIWSGGAANAANGELGTNIGELLTLQNGLATVITWDRHVALSIVKVKSDITDNVEAAHQQINVLETDAGLDAAERTTAINTVIIATYGANVTVMEGAAERILASKSWKPPANALKDLLDQKTPPPLTLPDGMPQVPPVTFPDNGIPQVPPAPVPPVEDDRPRPGPAQPAPATPPPVMPVSPSQPSPGAPAPAPIPPPTPAMPPTPGQPSVPSAPTPATPGPAVPGAPGIPGGGPAAAPLGPAAPAQPLSAGGSGKGVAPASATAAPPSAGARADESSASVSPAAATGMPAAPLAGGSGGAAAGSGSGSGARNAAPVGQKASTSPSATRPAAATRSTARRIPAAAQAHSTDRADSADEVAPPPIIPVSAARAERDAIAEAADAARGGSDPLRVARHIAGALNAPGSGGEGNLGFFWVTAVTTDGAIVVANSYGLAYIPDGVELPEQVHMASADEAIPAAERARWATYPVMAVQGWAEHHDKKLRAVIATEQQFASSDPGAAKVVLSADDIPATGAMVGRSRLQVVDPEAADRLAATSDPRLIDLLPPAPAGAEPAQQRATSEATDSDAAAQLAASVAAGTVDAQQLLAALPATPADAGPPTDERPTLWFDVLKPLASKATGRTAAHLRAFHKFAAHSQEVVLTEARTAADLVAQRSAVADWLYWKHLTELLDAALAGAS